MASMFPEDPDGTARKANDLYWNSDRSVNSIAEEMELSKGRLYGLIRPLDANLACPNCGEGMVHPNRTARERGYVSCAACGEEGDRQAISGGRNGSAELWVGSTASPVSGDRDGSSKNRILLGGVLVGAAMGALVLGYVRSR